MKASLAASLIFLAGFSALGQKLELVWKSDTLLRVPESVCFDKRTDVLYVSNIEGHSSAKDGNGFISKLGLDGKVKILKWATGLHAPKGMSIFKNKLFVADLTRVAVIELGSGKMTHSIDIEGAKFLNDITIDATGKIFVSDSETGKIFHITGFTPALYYEGTAFKRINGLLAINNGLIIADAGTGTSYFLEHGKKLTRFAQIAEGSDGIVLSGMNEYLVSSWAGEIYFIDAQKKVTKILDTKNKKLNSADIEINRKDKMIYVPTFFGNCVMAYRFTR